MRGARPHAALEARVLRDVAPAPGETLLAAVSGGPDSGALAALLAHAADAAGATLVLGHVNHGVRASAWQDEAVVLALGTALRARVLTTSLEPGPANEASLREARYVALAAHARRCGARRVFTAHHARDQTETVLLALFRGAGPDGLCGMLPERELAPGLALVRPLLRFEPAELHGYAAAAHLPHALDPTNADSERRRNALRALLPTLRDAFPRLDAAVARHAAIATGARANAPRARLRERLRAEVAAQTGTNRDVSFERLDAAAHALERDSRGRHFLRRGVEMVVTPSAVAAIEYDEAEIARTVRRLAGEIARDLAREPVLLIGVLKGALFFLADLARALPAEMDIDIDTLALSSYGNAHRTSGEVRMLKDTSSSVEGRNVVVVEDIVDNGLTLAYLQHLLRSRKPASLRTCVLLDKPYRRRADVTLDYVGLPAPDAFIVGYGLDYQEKYRRLPYLARLHDRALD